MDILLDVQGGWQLPLQPEKLHKVDGFHCSSSWTNKSSDIHLSSLGHSLRVQHSGATALRRCFYSGTRALTRCLSDDFMKASRRICLLWNCNRNWFLESPCQQPQSQRGLIFLNLDGSHVHLTIKSNEESIDNLIHKKKYRHRRREQMYG